METFVCGGGICSSGCPTSKAETSQELETAFANDTYVQNRSQRVEQLAQSLGLRALVCAGLRLGSGAPSSLGRIVAHILLGNFALCLSVILIIKGGIRLNI